MAGSEPQTMKPVRVVLADDEPLALDRLTRLLGKIDAVELVGTASTGEAAVQEIAKRRPDLVILDVDMPRSDGLDVVEIVARNGEGSQEPVPLFAFATAYPQFAIDAFETGALDFLCKPVRLARLEKMMQRVREALEQREAAERLRELRDRLPDIRRTATAPAQRTFWFKNRGNIDRIMSGDIEWIAAEGQYVRLHIGSRSYLLRESIASIAEQLADHDFIRIHRSTVVNRRRVVRVKASRTSHRLALESGTDLAVGRKYRAAVRGILGDIASPAEHAPPDRQPSESDAPDE